MTEEPTLKPLRIETLGGLRISLGDSAGPSFVSRKVDALLIYLACTQREHPRETLAELLWDDLSQERTMGNLRTALSDLQKHLAPYLIVTRYSAGVAPDTPLFVDLVTLTRALDTADRALQLNESLTAAAAAALSDALQLVNGDFLRGFTIKAARGFEGWYTLEAERIRGRIIEAYGRLADHALGKRLYKQAAEYASRTLAFDPLWEPAHRILMRALACGGQRSQAISQYELCCRLLDEELGLEPEDETATLYKQIISGKISAQAEVGAAPSLALPSTLFVPRPTLEARIEALLNRTDARLISLVGPGGCGKTRLALNAAAKVASAFPDGVVFVPLERAEDVTGAIAAIVGALPIGPQDLPLERRLIEYLYGREMLLVLDTVERVAGMAAFVERLITVARSTRILITSQIPLNIKAEYTVSIGGMNVPPPDAVDAGSYPSVALFARHAERIAGSFDLSTHLPDVAALCAEVDGNPLAIELAAAWSRLMTPAQILSEIQRSSDFLTSNASDIPERHRSMRAVFDWMWARFSPADRELAAKFAVFSGDFSPETASAVTGESPAMLQALADRSLIMQNGGRCRIHGLLRSFLIEKLHDQPELYDAMQHRHASYMATWARDQIASLIDFTANDSIAQMIREADNLSSAWDYAIAVHDFASLEPLAEASFYFHRAMNRYAEGAALMDAAVAASAGRNSQTCARLSAFAGVLHMSRSHYEEARALLTQSLSELPAHDVQLLRIAHDALGGTAYAQGDYETARISFETALDIAYHINDPRGAAYALFRLGDIQAVLGDYDSASALLSEGLSLGDDAASPHDRVRYLNLLADLSCKSGDYEAARGYAEEALSAATIIGSRVQRGVALATLGRAAYGRKAYKESRDFLRRSIAQAEEIGNRWGKAFAQAYLARTCWQLNELAAARFHLEQAQVVANDIQSAWLMAFIQRLRALPNIERGSSPIPTLGIALHLARSIKATPLALDALAAIAAGLSGAGEHEAAVQFARVTAADPTAEADAREVALAVLSSLPAVDPSVLTRDQAFDLAVTMSGRFHPHVA